LNDGALHITTVCDDSFLGPNAIILFQGSFTFDLKLLETPVRVKVTQQAGWFTGSRASGLNGNRQGQQQVISPRTSAGDSGMKN